MEEKNLMQQLGAALKDAGLPLLEDQLLILEDVAVKLIANYPYKNVYLRALVPLAVQALDPLIDAQIEKIDETDNA